MCYICTHVSRRRLPTCATMAILKWNISARTFAPPSKANVRSVALCSRAIDLSPGVFGVSFELSNFGDYHISPGGCARADAGNFTFFIVSNKSFSDSRVFIKSFFTVGARARERYSCGDIGQSPIKASLPSGAITTERPRILIKYDYLMEAIRKFIFMTHTNSECCVWAQYSCMPCSYLLDYLLLFDHFVN